MLRGTTFICTLIFRVLSTHSRSLDGSPWVGLTCWTSTLLVLSWQVEKNISAEFPWTGSWQLWRWITQRGWRGWQTRKRVYEHHYTTLIKKDGCIQAFSSNTKNSVRVLPRSCLWGCYWGLNKRREVFLSSAPFPQVMREETRSRLLVLKFICYYLFIYLFIYFLDN